MCRLDRLGIRSRLARTGNSPPPSCSGSTRAPAAAHGNRVMALAGVTRARGDPRVEPGDDDEGPEDDDEESAGDDKGPGDDDERRNPPGFGDTIMPVPPDPEWSGRYITVPKKCDAPAGVAAHKAPDPGLG